MLKDKSTKCRMDCTIMGEKVMEDGRLSEAVLGVDRTVEYASMKVGFGCVCGGGRFDPSRITLASRPPPLPHLACQVGDDGEPTVEAADSGMNVVLAPSDFRGELGNQGESSLSRRYPV